MAVAGHLIFWTFMAVLCVSTVRTVTRTVVKDGYTQWQVILNGIGLVLLFAVPAVTELVDFRGLGTITSAGYLTLGAAAVCVSVPMVAHYLSRYRRWRTARLPSD